LFTFHATLFVGLIFYETRRMLCLLLYVPGYHAGLWDNCRYNVTENVTLETCLDKLTREFARITTECYAA